MQIKYFNDFTISPEDIENIKYVKTSAGAHFQLKKINVKQEMSNLQTFTHITQNAFLEIKNYVVLSAERINENEDKLRITRNFLEIVCQDELRQLSAILKVQEASGTKMHTQI